MPVYSMTGYASASLRPSRSEGAAADCAVLLGLEIRSVNGRFLDLSLRLSEELRASEPALRQRLQGRLKRGKVELRAWVEGRTEAALRAPTAAELQKLLSVQDQIRAWLPQSRELSVAEVLQTLARASVPVGDLNSDLLQLAEQVLDELCAARQREGQRLVAMLQQRLQQLHALAEQVQPLLPTQIEQQRLRFLERFHEALGQTGAPADSAAVAAAQERALAEACAYAIRIDVAEELSRLRSHLEEFAALLQQGGEVGKRLEFLIQELQREANTLGSKSSSLELTRLALDMKVLIEQLREQVQNIE